MKILKEWFKKRSMRTKMTVAFSIPLMVIAVFASIIGYRIVASKYTEKILYSANQSYEQAVSYLKNHIQNMNYVQLLLYTNKNLQAILNSGVFQSKDYAEQYREYWKLDDIIVSVDLSNNLYSCALYVPDYMIYAKNHHHFFPLSRLAEDILNKLTSGGFKERLCFSDVETVPVRNNLQLQNQISLLKLIYQDTAIKCIGRVSISIATLENILLNADVTKKGFSCIINERNQIIAASKNSQFPADFLTEITKSVDSNGQSDFRSDLNWKKLCDGQGEVYYIRSQLIPEAQWTMVSMMKQEDFYQESRIVLQTFAFFAVLMVLSIVFISYYLAGYFTRRLTNLSSRMVQVQNGNLTPIDTRNEPMDEIGRLFEQFRYMTGEMGSLMQEQYRLGKEVKSSELKALQAQINPHFLYNTLDIISWQAKDHEAEEIVTIVQNLARFYRISLNRGRSIITVAEELEHVKAYVKIQNYRFNNQVYLDIKAQDEVLQLPCLKIILQPFVENSIMHGIAQNRNFSSCHVSIEVFKVANSLVFTLTDDGPGMSAEQIENILKKNTDSEVHGYGAQNTHFRIQLYYGDEYGVLYQSTLGEGTRVTVKIAVR